MRDASAPSNLRRHDILPLLFFVGVCLVGGVAGSLPSHGSVPTWYAALLKPRGTPPPWVFAPVWTTLYIMMGVAAFVVWQHRDRGRDAIVDAALVFFAVQLLLNFAWSPVFFGARSTVGGLVVITALWLALAATTVLFFRVGALAGVLLLPYLAWVSFSVYLNAGLFVLNR